MPVIETTTPGWWPFGRRRGETKVIEPDPPVFTSGWSNGNDDPLAALGRLLGYYRPPNEIGLSGTYDEKTQLHLRSKQLTRLGLNVALFIANAYLMLWLIGGRRAFEVGCILFAIATFLYLFWNVRVGREPTPRRLAMELIAMLAMVAAIVGSGNIIVLLVAPCPLPLRVAFVYSPAFLGIAVRSGAAIGYWARELWNEYLPLPPQAAIMQPVLEAYAETMRQRLAPPVVVQPRAVWLNGRQKGPAYNRLLDFYVKLLAARSEDKSERVPGRRSLSKAFGSRPVLRDGTELGKATLAALYDELARFGIISEPDDANRRHFIMPPAKAMELLQRAETPPPQDDAGLEYPPVPSPVQSSPVNGGHYVK